MFANTLRRAGAIRSVFHLALVSGPIAGALTSLAPADIVGSYVVGAGAASSTVQVDFANGNGYMFEVRFDGTISGWDALQLMASASPFTALEADWFPWGPQVTGIGIGSDYDYGTGDLWPIENFWHYWAMGDGGWEWSMAGAVDRMLTDGSADAWVFGSGANPQLIPGAPGLALLALAGVALNRRR